MAKKKKTQLKPVARGFATTSLPKKVVPVVDDEPDSSSLGGDGAQAVLGEVKPSDTNAAVQNDEFDVDKLEEQSLQNLVDKLQEKTEKDIIRTIKAIEVDRRFAMTLPKFELDPIITERIINLALESENIADGPRKGIEESEDKAVARIAITYGVLRRLGFSEERVVECLTKIPGLDLEEAYDWLYTHCTEDELEDKRLADNTNDLRTPMTPRGPPRTPRTPRVPSEFLTAPPTPTHTLKSQLDAHAPPFVPASPSLPIPDPLLNTEHEDIKSRVLASLEASNSASDSESDPVEGIHPNSEYAKLKVQLENGALRMAEVQRIRARLDVVKKNLFFNKSEADKQYEVALAKSKEPPIRSVSLRQRKDPKLKPRPPVLQQSALPPDDVVAVDVFDDEGDDSSGGMLQLLDAMPTSETTDTGTIISIRDMALPKHWSGRTSKVMLAETVAKADRYAAVTYSMISGSSRAKRASVCVRWDSKKTEEWSMEDIACYDDTQAEQYIATVALHALTFPLAEGFAGSTTSTGTQTFFRLLPAVFRDLWDELEETRKLKEDSINRSVWATLRSIVEPKLDPPSRTSAKVIKPSTDARLAPARGVHLSVNEGLREQLALDFMARQASWGYKEMLAQRNTLPIASYRKEIIDTLNAHQVLVLSGETGCGKSTQVPTFILEDQLSRGQPCKIFCTEPRRISAISLAQRVSRELGDHPNAMGTPSSLVGYSIRLESNTSKNTRLTFVTNGIALRMLEGGSGAGGQGVAFDEITHIIIDEVHERTIESDFLLIVLKSLLEQRSDLKVILMSATVDAEKISDFFGGCPTLHVPGRTFPVDVQYLEDAVQLTQWSIAENSPYARKLHDKFYKGKNRVDWSEDLTAGDEDDSSDPGQETVKLEKRYTSATATTINLFDERQIPYELIIRLLEKICFEDRSYFFFSNAILIFLPGLGEIRKVNDLLAEHPLFSNSDEFIIYPLHSTLSSENQGAVFEIPPAGMRKIVIATNIAETGITIPDITCVIDSGKHREMRFDEKRQISRLVETFVARSNAAQRRGRAGRVQEGLCFHLFTRYRHDIQLVDHPLPEMMRLSLSDLALRIKIMKVKLGNSIEDVLSRAMDPPVAINVQRAISMLVEVRALTSTEEITPMGRLLSKLPTDVHLGKFLLIATIFRCLDPALTIAAALNSKSPFLSPFGQEQEADRAKQSFRTENSDFLTIHNAFASWRRVSTQSPSTIRKFCRTSYLSHQIEELRQQFLGYLIDSSFIQVDKAFVRDLSRSRYGRNRNRFITVPRDLDCNAGNATLLNAALAAGLFPKILAVESGGQMRTITNNQQASFHPSSVNFGRKPRDMGTHHLAYFTLMQSRKLYAWETGPVDDLALILLCGEADTKLISDTLFIDRNKIKYRIPPKSNIALKYLRTQLAALLAHQFRGKPLLETQVLWNEMATTVLGKVKVEGDVGLDVTISRN